MAEVDTYLGDEDNVLSKRCTSIEEKEHQDAKKNKISSSGSSDFYSELWSSVKKTLFVIGSVVIILFAVGNSVAQ